MGYTNNMGRAYNTKRKKKYLDYKKHVQQVVGEHIQLPLHATKERPVRIRTVSFFYNGTHPDPENVHKGVKDALFYGAQNGDKYTGGSYEPPLYDRNEPRVVIEIETSYG